MPEGCDDCEWFTDTMDLLGNGRNEHESEDGSETQPFHQVSYFTKPHARSVAFFFVCQKYIYKSTYIYLFIRMDLAVHFDLF